MPFTMCAPPTVSLPAFFSLLSCISTWKQRRACSSTRSLRTSVPSCSCSSCSSSPFSSNRSSAFHPPASSNALSQFTSLLSIAALTSIRFFSVGSARTRRAAACGVMSKLFCCSLLVTRSSYLGNKIDSSSPPLPSAPSESVSVPASTSSSSSSSSSLATESLQSTQSSSCSSPIGDFFGANTSEPNIIARRISSIPSMHIWITPTHSCKSLIDSHWKKKLLLPCAHSPRQFFV
mmetsp:Transcript_16981/g.38648  ORF Transcript_16981/g.38648 Transcript_16981/m.38648 type:complete len:234 (-) Transcript_16981:361-1062(-)